MYLKNPDIENQLVEHLKSTFCNTTLLNNCNKIHSFPSKLQLPMDFLGGRGGGQRAGLSSLNNHD